MAILDNIKAAGELINTVGDVDLRSKLIDLQADAIKVGEQNLTLASEVADLRLELETRESLSFERNFYWRECGPNGDTDGPYCSACWDGDQQLIRLHQFSGRFFGCPVCGVVRTRDGQPAMHGTCDAFRRSSRGGDRMGSRGGRRRPT